MASDGDLAWAEDVVNAYRYLGRRATVRTLGSRSAKELHNWANEPGNRTEFLKMVKDATTLLARFKQSQTPAEYIIETKKTGAELRELIKMAVERSSDVDKTP